MIAENLELEESECKYNNICSNSFKIKFRKEESDFENYNSSIIQFRIIKISLWTLKIVINYILKSINKKDEVIASKLKLFFCIKRN